MNQPSAEIRHEFQPERFPGRVTSMPENLEVQRNAFLEAQSGFMGLYEFLLTRGDPSLQTYGDFHPAALP